MKTKVLPKYYFFQRIKHRASGQNELKGQPVKAEFERTSERQGESALKAASEGPKMAEDQNLFKERTPKMPV